MPATTGCFPSKPSCTPSRRALHEAQNAWLAQIDSLRAPDRKTHELIRMVCTVILRNPPGVQRHAMLAAEVGATWEEIAGSIVLTEPAFGLLRVVEALPWARRGWERGRLRRRRRRKAPSLVRASGVSADSLPSGQGSSGRSTYSVPSWPTRRRPGGGPPPKSARCTMVVRVSRADASTGSPANCRS